MKQTRFLLILITLFMICSFPIYADDILHEVAIYDYAEILSPEAEEKLESLGNEYSEKLKIDIVFLTTNDDEGLTSREYSDDFYDGLGSSSKTYSEDGIIFFINMDYRELYIGTTGKMIKLLNDNSIDKALDSGYSYASNGDYDNAMYFMSAKALEIAEASTLFNILNYISITQIAVSIIISIGICLLLLWMHNSANKKVDAQCYTGDTGITVSNKNEVLVRRYDTVSHGYYKKSSSSGRSSGGSSHRSSSGRSHGGGGRRF